VHPEADAGAEGLAGPDLVHVQEELGLHPVNLSVQRPLAGGFGAGLAPEERGEEKGKSEEESSRAHEQGFCPNRTAGQIPFSPTSGRMGLSSHFGPRGFPLSVIEAPIGEEVADEDASEGLVPGPFSDDSALCIGRL